MPQVYINKVSKKLLYTYIFLFKNYNSKSIIIKIYLYNIIFIILIIYNII